MTQSRTSTPFEDFFNTNADQHPDQRSVIQDTIRNINSQKGFIDGLTCIDIRFFNADEKTDIADYFPSQSTLPSIRKFLSKYLHQGSLGNIAQTFYFIEFNQKGFFIQEKFKNEESDRRYYICLQQDKSAIYIDQFEIVSYAKIDKPDDLISSSKSEESSSESSSRNVLAKIVTISHMKPNKVIKPKLIMHKVFMMDMNAEILFNENDPYLEKCYDKTNDEINDKIDTITLPFKIYGALFSYNQLSSKKIKIPSLTFDPDWKNVTETIDKLILSGNWITWRNSLSQINWDLFAQDIVENRFLSHYEIAARRFIPDKLPVIEQHEINELKQALDQHQIKYQLEKDNSDESVKEFLKLKIGLKRTLKDIRYLRDIIQNILEKIVILSQKNRQNYQAKLADFDNEWSHLYLASYKCEDELMKAAYHFCLTIQTIREKTEFSMDELDHLIQLVMTTKLLVTNLNKNKQWDEDTGRVHIEMYDNELKKYFGKFKKSATVPKVITGLGAATTGASGLGAAGMTYLPTLFAAPLVAAGPVITVVPLIAGFIGAGIGLFAVNQTQKGELWKAGNNVVQAAKASTEASLRKNI